MDDVLEITGSVTLDEAEAFRPGAILSVKLVDPDGEVLAATAAAVDELPAAFTLHVDPAQVARPDRLFLWALLRDGDAGWGTLELARVTDDHPTIALAPVPSGGAQ
ncbi:hypothetical protein BHE97_02790 [Aeromicrobium sp. PE09-221]|uniref:YbaY family lipoprotein n=1 Tax=Aeromicrobium sp. PE09-221 TaxID=1898043 RepID=UPI000B3EA7E9|nr:YbaY family lipoprotein [Aeromicrobium sp. PE09-221]OUZ12137.1 hypothetical protein BHE97_02790 [Aeromicrobium sp. PE09-221]